MPRAADGAAGRRGAERGRAGGRTGERGDREEPLAQPGGSTWRSWLSTCSGDAHATAESGGARVARPRSSCYESRAPLARRVHARLAPERRAPSLPPRGSPRAPGPSRSIRALNPPRAARVRVRGPAPILSEVDLVLPPGFTALVGENGAGKSTLLALVAGALAPDAGRVRLGAGGGGDRRLPAGGPPAQGSTSPRSRGATTATRAACARRSPSPPRSSRAGRRSRRASGSAGRSAPRSRRSRTCSSSTSRRTTPTRPRARTSSPRCEGSAAWASSSRTIARSSRRSPRARCGSTGARRGCGPCRTGPRVRRGRPRSSVCGVGTGAEPPRRTPASRGRKLGRRAPRARGRGPRAGAAATATRRTATPAPSVAKTLRGLGGGAARAATSGGSAPRGARGRRHPGRGSRRAARAARCSSGGARAAAAVLALAGRGRGAGGGQRRAARRRVRLGREARVRVEGPNGAGKTTLLAALLAASTLPPGRRSSTCLRSFRPAQGARLLEEVRALARDVRDGCCRSWPRSERSGQAARLGRPVAGRGAQALLALGLGRTPGRSSSTSRRTTSTSPPWSGSRRRSRTYPARSCS